MESPRLIGEILEAAAFATEAHRGQCRQGGDTPYTVHPLRVAARVARLPAPDRSRRRVRILAALLHDVLEDTEVGSDEIERRFGADVARVVRELTKDVTFEKAERKRRMIARLPTLSHDARCVKLADRLDNLRDMSGMPDAFKRRYLPESRQLLEQLRGTCEELEREVEAEIARYESGG